MSEFCFSVSFQKYSVYLNKNYLFLATSVLPVLYFSNHSSILSNRAATKLLLVVILENIDQLGLRYYGKGELLSGDVIYSVTSDCVAIWVIDPLPF